MGTKIYFVKIVELYRIVKDLDGYLCVHEPQAGSSLLFVSSCYISVRLMALWAKLQRALDNGDSPDELAALVRLLQEATSDQSLSTDQKELLVDAACAALNDNLSELLQDSQLEEFAPVLVAKDVCDFQKLSQAIDNHELDELPQVVRRSLVSKLKSQDEELTKLWKLLKEKQSTAESGDLELLIREILQMTTSTSWTIEQKQLMISTASIVLEPAVVELLNELNAREFGPMFVERYTCNLNHVALAIGNGTLDELPKLLRDAIALKLESRSEILKRVPVAKSAEWISTFCEKFPTKDAIQQAKWSTIENLLMISGDNEIQVPHEQENAIWQVWSENLELRRMLQKYGLSPACADSIEEKGSTTISSMTIDEISCIQNEASSSEKSKLMRMWRHESNDGKETEKLRKTKSKHLQEKTKEAIKLTSSLKIVIKTRNKAAINDSLQRLSTLTTELGIDDWRKELGDLDDSKEVDQMLSALADVLESADVELDGVAGKEYDSDEMVIARASAGAALYGIAFGLDDSKNVKKPPKPLLQPPQYCPLLSPAIGIASKSVICYSVESAQHFRSTVSSCGDSISAMIKGSELLLESEGDGGTGVVSGLNYKSQDETKSTCAVRMVYGVVPTKAFRIPVEDMKLKVEASHAARAISTRAQARLFLEDYGSHIPSGNQHFGGIFWKIVEMKTKESTSLKTLEIALTKETNCSLSLSIADLSRTGGGMTVRYNTSEIGGSANGDINHKGIYRFTTNIECIGPPIKNYDMFVKVLLEKNQSWYLIDRGNLEGLVPVWDLLQRSGDEDLVTAGDLLREEWIELAHRSSSISQISCLVYRARLANPNVIDSTRTLNLKNKTYSERAVKKEVKKLCSVNIERIDQRQLRYQVQQVFAMIDRFDCQFDEFLLATLMGGEELPRFLKQVSECSHDKTKPTLSFLAARFDEVTRVELENATPPVSLGRDFEKALERMVDATAHENVWYPPVIPLCKLPGQIRSIVDCLRENDMITSDLLTKRIGSLLSVNIWTSSKRTMLHEDFQNLAAKYHCSRDGFSYILKNVFVEPLIKEMEDLLIQEKRTSVGLYKYVEDQEPDHECCIDVSLTNLSGAGVDHFNTYRDIRVDRRKTDCVNDPQKLLLYALMHRLEISTTFYGVSSENNVKTPTCRGRTGRGRRTKPRSEPKPSAFDAAVGLLSSADVASQSEICRLLLDHRLLVPWITPTPHTATSKQPFHCNVAALDFVNTVIGHDGEEVTIANIATDTNLLRVALISERLVEVSEAKFWVKSVFHAESFHAMDCKQKATMNAFEAAVEIGWGFLKTSEGKIIPVMLLHVIGNYRCLKAFIESFCDAVVADIGSNGTCDIKFDKGLMVKWEHASLDQENEPETDEDADFYVTLLKCKFTESIERITDLLIEQYDLIKHQDDRVMLASVKCDEIDVAVVLRADFNCLGDQFEFSTVRKEPCLQTLFAEEGRQCFSIQRVRRQIQDTAS